MRRFHVPFNSVVEVLTFFAIVAIALAVIRPFAPRSSVSLSSSEVSRLAGRAEKSGLAEDRILAAIAYASMLHHVGSIREGSAAGDPAHFGLGDEDQWRRFLGDAERFASKAGPDAEEQRAFRTLRLEILTRRGSAQQVLEGIWNRPSADSGTELGGFHQELLAVRAHLQLGQEREALQRLHSLQQSLGGRIEGAPEWEIRLGLAALGPMRTQFGDLRRNRNRSLVMDHYQRLLRSEIDQILNGTSSGSSPRYDCVDAPTL